MFAYVGFPLLNVNAQPGSVPFGALTVGAQNQGSVAAPVNPSPQLFQGVVDQNMLQTPQQNMLCYVLPVTTTNIGAQICQVPTSVVQGSCNSMIGQHTPTNPLSELLTQVVNVNGKRECSPLTQPQVEPEAPLDLSSARTVGEPTAKRPKVHIDTAIQEESIVQENATSIEKDANKRRDRWPSGASLSLSVTDSAYVTDDGSIDAQERLTAPSVEGLPEDTQLAKKQRRRERNKIAAKKLRNKTRTKKLTLTEEAQELEEKNEKLRQTVKSIEEELDLLKKNLRLVGAAQTKAIIERETIEKSKVKSSLCFNEKQTAGEETFAGDSRPMTPVTPSINEQSTTTFCFDNNQTYLELNKIPQHVDLTSLTAEGPDNFMYFQSGPRCARENNTPCERSAGDFSDAYSDGEDLDIDIDYHDEAEQQMLPSL